MLTHTHMLLYCHTVTQRYPEPETKSAGTETNQVLNQKVRRCLLQAKEHALVSEKMLLTGTLLEPQAYA